MGNLNSDANFTVDPVSEEQKTAARRTVAQTAVRLGAGAEDVRTVLALLDLLPTSTPAEEAEKPKPRQRVAQSISADRARLWLCELRKVTTMTSVAKECGVSRSALSDIANGVIERIMPETERAILAVSGVGVAAPA